MDFITSKQINENKEKKLQLDILKIQVGKLHELLEKEEFILNLDTRLFTALYSHLNGSLHLLKNAEENQETV